MQHLKLLFKITLIISIQNAINADYFQVYVKEIKKNCNDANSLVVKKSLISLVNDADKSCSDNFSKTLIDKCSSKITCLELYAILDSAKSKANGNVVGN